MLDVTVSTKVTRPEYQVFTSRVQLYGFDTLTPRAARAALEIAGYHTGTVSYTSTDKSGENTYRKTYRVYAKSARLIEDEVY